MTNREKLAQMSNDELAEFICEQHTMCINCIGQTECCTVCHCDKDGHYIGYVANFTQVCEEWEETDG